MAGPRPPVAGSQFSGILATCAFDPVALLGDGSHDAASALAAMVPTVAAFREAAPAVPTASLTTQLLLVSLMGAAGIAAFARRR